MYASNASRLLSKNSLVFVPNAFLDGKAQSSNSPVKMDECIITLLPPMCAKDVMFLNCVCVCVCVCVCTQKT